MYIWLVLSTFLAILAGYSLPMRSDTPEKVNVPVASAHMSKMVINHRSALDYARKQKWPYYCEGMAEGTPVDDCEKSIGFESGPIDSEHIEDYVPQDFTYSDDYLSAILCLNEDNTETTNCKNEEGVRKKRFLFTYGDLHEKWLSSNSLVAGEGSSVRPDVTPNEDMIKAFWQHFGSDEYVGYIKEKDGEVNIINYQGIPVFTVPQAMWESMSGSCNITYNGSCIAYVSIL